MDTAVFPNSSVGILALALGLTALVVCCALGCGLVAYCAWRRGRRARTDAKSRPVLDVFGEGGAVVNGISSSRSSIRGRQFNRSLSRASVSRHSVCGERRALSSYDSVQGHQRTTALSSYDSVPGPQPASSAALPLPRGDGSFQCPRCPLVYPSLADATIHVRLRHEPVASLAPEAHIAPAISAETAPSHYVAGSSYSAMGAPELAAWGQRRPSLRRIGSASSRRSTRGANLHQRGANLIRNASQNKPAW